MSDRRFVLPGPPRFVLWLVAGNLLVALAFTASLVVGTSGSGFIARQLDPGGEANLPTWYSSMQWALAAALLAIYARFPPAGLTGGVRLYLPTLGALVLSLDEVAGIHEWVGQRSDFLLPGGTRAGTAFSSSGIWMFILLPVVIVAGIWVARLLVDHLRAAPRATALFAAGALLFMFGAAGLELATNAAAGDRSVQLAISTVEEVCELIGASLVVWGAWELLQGTGRQRERTTTGL
ncbi:MAG: hypothetical protein ACR2I5_13170 [Candidatus Limnocylindria bacterium]